jgi:hypothetical protein
VRKHRPGEPGALSGASGPGGRLRRPAEAAVGGARCGRVESNHQSHWRRGYSALSSPVLGVRRKARQLRRRSVPPTAAAFRDLPRRRRGSRGRVPLPRKPPLRRGQGGRSGSNRHLRGSPPRMLAVTPRPPWNVGEPVVPPRTPSFRFGARIRPPWASRAAKPPSGLDRLAHGAPKRSGRRDRLPATGGRDVAVSIGSGASCHPSAPLPAHVCAATSSPVGPGGLSRPAAR